jgi:hypothetical protein
MVHGTTRDWDAFALEPGFPVYADGSAIHVQYPEIAQDGAAAFQVDSSGRHKVFQAWIPPSSWPVSAVTAEFLAIDLASRALQQPYQDALEALATEVFIDCQVAPGVVCPQ